MPKLPSLAKLPKPKFGNIARAIATPAQQVTSGAKSTSIASATRQPPPPPARKFDSAATDRQLAQALETKKKFTPDVTADASEANGELTAAQKRFKEAIAKSQKPKTDLVAQKNTNGGLWGDYRPDTAPSASNNATVNDIEDLAQINRNLYDQYGKLTTVASSPKLSQPIDASVFAAKVSDADIEKTNESVAELKAQLEKLKARGRGTSDEFSIPSRSAVELAGSAPLAPIKNEPAPPLHKGFGKKIQLKPASDLANQGVVRIADPTAPANVLRASASEIPGLIQPTQVAGAGKYSATQFGGYTSNDVDPSQLPTGNRLPPGDDELVDNQFVASMNQQEIPTLTATATPKSFEMPLPRAVSEASLAAIAENARVAAEMPQPKITFQNPIEQTPVAMPQAVALNSQVEPVVPVASSVPPAPTAPSASAATMAAAAPVSAFQLPATESPRVMRNQFFQRAIEASAPLNVPAAPAERVAELSQQDFSPMSIMQQPEPSATALPADLVTGDSTYAPGSVVKPQDESLWR